MRQPGKSLRRRSDTEVVVVCTRLPHPADLQIYESRIDFSQSGISQFPSFHLRRTIVLAEHGRLSNKPFEEVTSLWQIHIEGNAVLARIDVVEQTAAIHTLAVSPRRVWSNHTE